MIRNLISKYETDENAKELDASSFSLASPFERTRRTAIEEMEHVTSYRVDILKRVTTFSALNHDQLRLAAQSLEEQWYKRGDNIICQDEIGDSFFILQLGQVVVTRKTVDDPAKELAILKKNSFFGEIALITEEKRNATITVTSHKAKCLILTKDVFSYLMRQTSELTDELKTRVATEVLKGIPFINSQSNSVKTQLVDAMTTITFNINAYICRQNTRGNTFYVVLEGSCKITINDETGKEVELNRIHPGDYFGEIALLQPNSMRTANVVSTSHVVCLVLQRADFISLLLNAKDSILKHAGKRSGLGQLAEDKDDDGSKGRRRITGFAQNANVVNNAATDSILLRMSRYWYEALWFNQYWKLYRRFILNPKKYASNPITADIIAKYGDDREAAVTNIRNAALRILTELPANRNEDEHNFVFELLDVKNDLRNEICKLWPGYKFRQLTRVVSIMTVPALNKICEAGQRGTTAMVLLRGSARVFTMFTDKVIGTKTVQYEQDLMPGEVFNESALGGMHKRLLTVQGVTECDILLIEGEAFLEAQGADYRKVTTEDKFNFLTGIPYFKDWVPYNLYRVAQHLEQHEVMNQSKVQLVGDLAPQLAFVFSGRFKVTGSNDTVLSYIESHGVYGETAVLNHHFADKKILVKKAFEGTKKGLTQGHKERSEVENIKNSASFRHGVPKRKPKYFTEFSPVVAECSAQVLSLDKKYFNLIDSETAKLILASFYEKCKWRHSRNKVLRKDVHQMNRAKKKMAEAAAHATTTTNPDEFYETFLAKGKANKDNSLFGRTIQYDSGQEEGDEDDELWGTGVLDETAQRLDPATPRSRAEGATETAPDRPSTAPGQVLGSSVVARDGHFQKSRSARSELSQTVRSVNLSSAAATSVRTGMATHSLTSSFGQSGCLPAVLTSSQGGRDAHQHKMDVEDIPKLINGQLDPVVLGVAGKNKKENKKLSSLLQQVNRPRTAKELRSKIDNTMSFRRLHGVPRPGTAASSPGRSGHLRSPGSPGARHDMTSSSIIQGYIDKTRGDGGEGPKVELKPYLSGSQSLPVFNHYYETSDPRVFVGANNWKKNRSRK
jgi:CRP-like cAMP-binding protein